MIPRKYKAFYEAKLKVELYLRLSKYLSDFISADEIKKIVLSVHDVIQKPDELEIVIHEELDSFAKAISFKKTDPTNTIHIEGEYKIESFADWLIGNGKVGSIAQNVYNCPDFDINENQVVMVSELSFNVQHNNLVSVDRVFHCYFGQTEKLVSTEILDLIKEFSMMEESDEHKI